MTKLVLATALLALGTVAASAQTGNFYGPTGDYLGSYNSSDGTTNFYGPTGDCPSPCFGAGCR